jgi:hypothetical protein
MLRARNGSARPGTIEINGCRQLWTARVLWRTRDRPCPNLGRGNDAARREGNKIVGAAAMVVSVWVGGCRHRVYLWRPSACRKLRQAGEDFGPARRKDVFLGRAGVVPDQVLVDLGEFPCSGFVLSITMHETRSQSSRRKASQRCPPITSCQKKRCCNRGSSRARR